MAIKVVIVKVDEEELERNNPDSSFEEEMGWVEESGLHMQNSIDIPIEAENHDPIETAWIMSEINQQIEHLKESDEITDITPENYIKIVKEIQGNYEPIEQDMIWKINDILGVKQ
ncbi:hypothetical protein JUJ52_02855 [Virgibacillus sp. AGTR]|uniref:hypothetical protein n=1 Tax=Virgibacillus sp. AGTR TaxID=2812055 RepID=UPI001D16484C|nr:hypothetical protein [Virgibacillus sp. AGTR]MCC2248896.1 hypothetical protein [Virgibacillus sp. AGTR]